MSRTLQKTGGKMDKAEASYQSSLNMKRWWPFGKFE